MKNDYGVGLLLIALGLGISSDVLNFVRTYFLLIINKYFGDSDSDETASDETTELKMIGSDGGQQIIAKEGGKVDMSTHIYKPSPTVEESKRKRKCPECLGEGKIPCQVPTCEKGFLRIPTGKLRCTTCKGIGKVLCKNCEGEGEIDAEMS